MVLFWNIWKKQIQNVLVLMRFIQVHHFQLHLWWSGDFCQIYRRETVSRWSVTSHSSPPVTFMSPFRPKGLSSLKSCLLNSLRPQATIQSLDASLSFRITGMTRQRSNAKWTKASPKAGIPTPLGTFLVSAVTVLSFNSWFAEASSLFIHFFSDYLIDTQYIFLYI